MMWYRSWKCSSHKGVPSRRSVAHVARGSRGAHRGMRRTEPSAESQPRNTGYAMVKRNFMAPLFWHEMLTGWGHCGPLGRTGKNVVHLRWIPQDGGDRFAVRLHGMHVHGRQRVGSSEQPDCARSSARPSASARSHRTVERRVSSRNPHEPDAEQDILSSTQYSTACFNSTLEHAQHVVDRLR